MAVKTQISILFSGIIPFLHATNAHAADPKPTLEAAGHHLTITTQDMTNHTILLDGQPLFHDKCDVTINFLGPFSGQGHTYAVLAEEAGGNACEVHYQAIDLTTLPAKISPIFGNCGIANTPIVKHGTLIVTTPSYTRRPYAGSPDIPAEKAVFLNGKLTSLP